ncbi:MAG: restriction endonuclease subunit R [Methanosarcinales archaeon]|nr:MAG: restriction endonuclease subunit R [Methanosarcinales archaeon]
MPKNETKDEAKQKIGELVERFRYNLNVYKKSAYNETQVRREFIDPFFEALGWDVSNKQGHAEQYKDVVHEDAIKVGRSTRAPDYSFRIGGLRKFFVEAKKPAVNIKDDVAPSYQLRRYAWSAKLPLSIVTDFEEISVYDCRIKPGQKDKASVGRIGYYTFEEYPDKLDEIYDVFSKDAVLKGSFDQYAQSTKGKRGTAEVDNEFLKEIESWREILAKNIALRNPEVSIHELNYAVQKIIDRVIFLRICEDRGIEPYGQLHPTANSTNIYTHLLNHFKLAELKYNSGIFNFGADAVTPQLEIDDKVLKTIIQSLYYPKSPYEFSVLGVEILGNVYEQFLGKVIRLTAGHQAKVETKPEVKKAGGVYYTPQYIVDYIVGNTVGKLVAGKTPEEIAEIKIPDPACGSGSFLIGAYTHLLRYHLDWYVENKPKKHKKAVFQVKENEWYLTTDEKKRILLNNIYGVDIDSQAVEVTKLSLQLKVLENESRESVDQQVKLGTEGILPNLGGNIKCGNSLIGPDFYDAGQTTLFDEDEMRRVNVFDWDDAGRGFGEIMGRGGFDCVIGNPPYVRQELLKEQKGYFKDHYQVYQGTADLCAYFIEKGVSLLQSGGYFSYIVANKWMRANYGKPLRQWLKTKRIEEIVDFGDLQVFQNATTYPCIMRISNGKPSSTFGVTQVETLEFSDLGTYVEKHQYTVNQDGLDDGGWALVDKETRALLDKLRKTGVPLGEYVDGKIYYGIKTGLNEAFVIDSSTRDKLITEDPKNAELIKPFLAGKDIKRYQPPCSKRYLILIPKGWTNQKSGGVKDAWNWLQNNYPGVASHLKPFSEKAQKRYDKGEYWWELRACDYYIEFEKPKIAYLIFQVKPTFTFDDGGNYCNNATYIIPNKDLLLLGILNSKLGWFLISSYCTQIQNGYQLIFKYFGKIPICTIDSYNPAEKAQHDKLVSLVDNMLDLQKKYDKTRMERDKELYERQIKIVDAQIDRLVYDLYGLTKGEIGIVEEE